MPDQRRARRHRPPRLPGTADPTAARRPRTATWPAASQPAPPVTSTQPDASVSSLRWLTWSHARLARRHAAGNLPRRCHRYPRQIRPRRHPGKPRFPGTADSASVTAPHLQDGPPRHRRYGDATKVVNSLIAREPQAFRSAPGAACADVLRSLRATTSPDRRQTSARRPCPAGILAVLRHLQLSPAVITSQPASVISRHTRRNLARNSKSLRGKITYRPRP